MKKTGIILAIAFFMILSSRGSEGSSRGRDAECFVCREDCERYGVPDGVKYCVMKYDVLAVETPGPTLCPEYSSYHTKSKKCECFEGYYSPSPRGNKCVRDIPLVDLCVDKFGSAAKTSEELNACFCKQGFFMENGKCVRDESMDDHPPSHDPISYLSFGDDEYTSLNTSWLLRSAIREKSGKSYAHLEWRLRKTGERKTAKSFLIRVWNMTTSELLIDTTTNAKNRHESFPLDDHQEFLAEIIARDGYGKEVSSVFFGFGL